jgi:hypothetical protein
LVRKDQDKKQSKNNMKKNEKFTLSIGDRKYKIKKATLAGLENQKITQFEKHLIQEGVKQILYCSGTEQIVEKDGHTFNQVPKEMIRFLLDYDVIEEANEFKEA